MHQHDPDCSHPDEISPILLQVLRENPEQVMGWLRNETGCWEVLAEQAEASRRAQREQALSDPQLQSELQSRLESELESDLQLVRDRLWWMLDQLKHQLAD